MRQLKFDPNTYSIIVDAKIKSKPAIIIKLILDTGSSVVVLPWKLVPLIGLKVDLKKVTVTLHLYSDMNCQKEINFWKKTLALP